MRTDGRNCPYCDLITGHDPSCKNFAKERAESSIDTADRPEGLVGPDSDPKPNPPRKNIVIDGVDKTKLRRAIEEDLRKETTVEEMVEYAQKRGIKIPHHPDTPPDFHNEPGRPYFGPHQVRHASDLKEYKQYILVTLKDNKRVKTRISFRGFKYISKTEKWYMAYALLNTPPLRGRGESLGEKPLESISLHPFAPDTVGPVGVGVMTWSGMGWLEFAPSATDCDCDTSYREVQNKELALWGGCETKGQHVCGKLGLIVH